MASRNKILSEIVVASGGVVTNAFNRNSLLTDWLLSVGGVPNLSAFKSDGTVICDGIVYENQTIYCGE